jgi:hypothetical protein
MDTFAMATMALSALILAVCLAFAPRPKGPR